MSPSPISEVLADLRRGRMVILVDDPSRENEGDLTMLAEHVTPEAINFMVTEARGLICLPMAGEVCDRLQLLPQVERNTSRMGTAFTVSIEAATGVTTGISAADRARTIRVAASPDAKPDDLARPGHIFPLRAKEGGVLVRGGQTEGIVELARLAGAKVHAGIVCEIMNRDGSMARMPQLEQFAEQHGLKIATIADLIAYRRRNERLVEPVVSDVPLPTHHGEFLAHVFRSKVDGGEHVALTRGLAGPGVDGPWKPVDGVVTVRVHSCLTGDVFGSLRCDCESQLHQALELLTGAASGVLLYLRQEGRGIGLANKLKAYKLQDEGLDTVQANQAMGFPADLREYGIGAQILHYLGVRRMEILTNNPKKMHGLAGYGLELVGQRPLATAPHALNERYLETKREKLGHLLEGLSGPPAR
jgi:3,4-dihydroxy 2-butanone 4-phosphate synthase/GTP cyclohydrolase II